MNRIIKLFFIILFLSSCDFSPRIHREILRAQDLLKSQNYIEASKVYEKILNKNISKEIKVKILYQLSQIYSVYLGNHEKAIVKLKEIIKTSDSPSTLVEVEEKMGEINFKFLNDYKESVKNYSNLTQFTPRLKNFERYRFRLAESFFNLHDYSNAIEIFKEIKEQSKDSFQAEAIYYLGVINFHQKNWNDAIAFLKEYIKYEFRKSRIVQAKFLIANAYETMENLKSAYNIYYSILGEYPNNDVIRNRLDSIYSRRVARKR